MRLTDDERIIWHNAFYDAIRLELDEYKDVLTFEFEHQLTTEPLRMDVLIIKKEPEAIIEKNIASIFKGHNVVEYKSPDDYLSVNNFHKVYGYACLYAALNTVPITDITLTFVETRRPRDLIGYMKAVRGWNVAEKWPGVYLVSGDILPIQLIESKKLPEADNLWLKNLGAGIKAENIGKVLMESRKKGKDAPVGAYLYWLARANPYTAQEAWNMKSKEAYTFDDFLVDTGILVRLEARLEPKIEARLEPEIEARAKKSTAIEIAQKLIGKGWVEQEVAEVAELPLETVRSLYTQTVTVGASTGG
jgi:hypothetical protein